MRTTDAERLLAAAPRAPDDVARFTSDALFGQPGIYPDGPPMTPAAVPRDDAWMLAQVERVLAPLGEPHRSAGRERLDDPHLVDVAPDLVVRAALVVLEGTAAAPLVASVGRGGEVDHLRLGAPASPGRVVGPPDGGTSASDARERVVNERYRWEHPALLAPSLAHDLLWDPTRTAHDPETILHALAAIVHLQLLARCAWLADEGTELARRQSSLAITLCNSRRAGSPRISMIAPDGTGTIPGGAPAMQTPDFWSVPFGPPGDSEAPAVLRDVLAPLAGAPLPDPLRFDRRLAEWLDAHAWGVWLPPPAHAAAARALGLI